MATNKGGRTAVVTQAAAAAGIKTSNPSSDDEDSDVYHSDTSSAPSRESNTSSAAKKKIKLSPFVAKLKNLGWSVEIDRTIAHWDYHGTIMIVENDDGFLEIMGASKLTSVIRQLHFFAFRKCPVPLHDPTVISRARAWAFCNELYRRDRQDLLNQIKRYQRASEKKKIEKLDDVIELNREVVTAREAQLLSRIRELEWEVRELRAASQASGTRASSVELTSQSSPRPPSVHPSPQKRWHMDNIMEASTHSTSPPLVGMTMQLPQLLSQMAPQFPPQQPRLDYGGAALLIPPPIPTHPIPVTIVRMRSMDFGGLEPDFGDVSHLMRDSENDNEDDKDTS